MRIDEAFPEAAEEVRAKPEPPRGDIAWRGASEVAEDVDERGVEVIAQLARHGEARVAFQGLRRSLGLHQQALARVLKRLERDGYVLRHEDGGYSLSERGFAALSLRGQSFGDPPHHAVTLVQALLPPSVSASAVRDRLAGRWFGPLRFIAVSDNPGESVITWATASGSNEVRVRLAGGAVSLEADVEDGDEDAAFAASAALLSALAALLIRGRRSRTRASAAPLFATADDAVTA